MTRARPMTRAQFLTRAAATVAGATMPTAAAGRASGSAAPRRLAYRGVGYEVADGGRPDTGWNAERMRRDLTAIAGDLHANSISVFGDGVRRLAETAEEAAQRGLHVWLQPRLADVPRKDILDHLGEAGRQADRLRLQGASIDLSVGAEFLLFVPGIVPGANAVERVHNLLSGRYDAERLQRRLSAFVADAARVGRSAFGGRLSYAAAEDDVVDWRLFDVVGIDYYASFPRRSQHVRALRRYGRWGKPVAIAEFGTCAYEGAASRGGLAWDVLDASGEGLKGHLVRSERAQARYLVDLVRIFEALGLDSATVYQFVTPDAPHRREGRYDLDMASYGIVKPIWATRDRPTPRWHWEPKEAFRALAHEYRQATRP
ncbi:MAG: hypothetical protein QOD69_718 [Solirubrobacteraceae bacterium]|jgi:hypothetical protein|nr:hypothetical protein [Solirubrobacteraceae bacterium]